MQSEISKKLIKIEQFWNSDTESGIQDTTISMHFSQVLMIFIFLQHEKVVILEELAAKFSLKTQAVIQRITDMTESGQLTGGWC